jgi:hypothetical protein
MIAIEAGSTCAPEDGVEEHAELKIFTIDKLKEPSIELSHTKTHQHTNISMKVSQVNHNY